MMLRVIAAILLMAAPLATGCVQRTVSIDTSPSGAEVFIDGNLVGNTPLTFAFTYYGNHQLRIVKEGYTTLIGKLELRAPTYEKPGIDFISENMVPWTIHDRHSAVFTLLPAQKANAGEAVVRAGEFADKSEAFRKTKTRDGR